MNMGTKLYSDDTYSSKRMRFVVTLLIVLSISFALLPSGLDWTHHDPRGSYVEGSPIFQLQFGSLFVIGALMAWRNWQWSFLHLRHMNVFLLLIVLYCAISILWSPYPFVTLKRVVQQVGLIIVALAIVPPVAYPRQFLNTLLGTFTALMVLSIVIVLTMPNIGIDEQLNHAWRGILPQKNGLGAISALCAIFWVRKIFEKNLPVWMCLAGIVFSLALLVMTKSTTALLVFMMCTGLYLLIRRRYLIGGFDNMRVLLSVLVVLLCALLVFFIFNSRLPVWSEIFFPIQYYFNKSVDLTGRTDIWHLVFIEIDKHPVFGIGYGAFWLGAGSPSQYIIDYLHWMPLQAHNGYIDIWNELGLVGLTLLTGIFLVHIVQLVKLMRIDREEAAIHWIIFLFIVVSNISESEILRGVFFQNILFIFSSVTISARLAMDRYTHQPVTNNTSTARLRGQ